MQSGCTARREDKVRTPPAEGGARPPLGKTAISLFPMRGRWGSLFNSFSGQHLIKSSGSFDSSVGLALRDYCKTREGNFKVL